MKYGLLMILPHMWILHPSLEEFIERESSWPYPTWILKLESTFFLDVWNSEIFLATNTIIQYHYVLIHDFIWQDGFCCCCNQGVIFSEWGIWDKCFETRLGLGEQVQKRREQLEGFGSSLGEGGLERCGGREDAVNEEL